MKNLFIHPESPIKNALKQIKKTSEKCLLIINKDKIFLGTLSDGDLRNAILKGSLKNTIKNFYNKKPTYFYQNKINYKKIENSLLKEGLTLIPILNNKNKVIRVITTKSYFKSEKKKIKSSPINMIIMAGGIGKRMKPLSNILPKALAPIRDKPIIQHIFEKFSQKQKINFTVSLNHQKEIMISFLSQLKKQFNIKFLKEKKLLGTAGSLGLIKNKNKNLIVTNCDTLIDIELMDLMKFHEDLKNDLTMVVSSKQYKLPYGTCKIDENNLLDKINEKPSFNFFINIGLYVIGPKILKTIKKNIPIDMTDLISNSKKDGKKIGVYPIEDDAWIDIGQWSNYKKVFDKIK